MAANMHASDTTHDSGPAPERDELRFSVPSIPELWAEVDESGAPLDQSDGSRSRSGRRLTVIPDPPDVDEIWDEGAGSANSEPVSAEPSAEEAPSKPGVFRRFARWLVTPG